MRLRSSTSVTFSCVLVSAALSLGCQDFNAIKTPIADPTTPPPEQRTQEPERPAATELRTAFMPSRGSASRAAIPETDVTVFDLADELPEGLTRSGNDVRVRKDYPTADDPHRQLGLVLLQAASARNAGVQAKIGALRAEAAKHGANTIVVQGCKSDGEICAATAFHIVSSATPAAAKGASDEEIVAALKAQLPPGTTITLNQNAAAGAAPPAPGSKAAATVAAADELLAAIARDKPSKTAVANNKALGTALIGIWMPNEASGETSETARATLNRELLRSMIYVDKTGDHVKLTPEGLIVAYTDEKSAPPKSKVVAVPAARLFELVAAKNIGVYLHHEGKASVFTGMKPEDLRDILAKGSKTK